jgi:hypothetical protein
MTVNDILLTFREIYFNISIDKVAFNLTVDNFVLTIRVLYRTIFYLLFQCLKPVNFTDSYTGDFSWLSEPLLKWQLKTPEV